MRPVAPKRFAAALLLASVAPSVSSAASAQITGPPSAAVERGYYAWVAGEYPTALAEFLRILSVSADPAVVAEIAGITGERLRSVQLLEDGRNPRFGGGGALLLVDTGPLGADTTVVFSAGAALERAAAVPAAAAVAGGAADRSLFTLTHVEGPELERARLELADARRRRSNLAFQAALRQVLWLEASGREVRIRDLATGTERVVPTPPGTVVVGLAEGGPGDVAALVVAGVPGRDGSSIFGIDAEGSLLNELVGGPGYRVDPRVAGDGVWLVYRSVSTTPVPVAPGSGGAPEVPGPDRVVLRHLPSGTERSFAAEAYAISADGRRVAWTTNGEGGGGELHFVSLDGVVGAERLAPSSLYASSGRLDHPALSPDGALVAWQEMTEADWEVLALPTDARAAPIPLSREIQHDQFPVFVTRGTVMALKGEERHRRAFLYDVVGGGRVRLHHNNTVRTIAPEYGWAVSPDGRWVVVVSDRDGDTVSPERGVFAVDLSVPIGRDELVDRLRAGLAAESELRARGDSMFAPLADSIRVVTETVDVGRLFEYAEALYSFGSKHVSQPGNRRAIDYLADRLSSFGYQPELQWFTTRDGIRTANVIARLPGRPDGGLTYVLGSHFDSHSRGPGADDNSSGASALLEVARVLQGRQPPATIEFVFFTGEEAGLQGSREYVRLAGQDGKRIVGALNNDMVGWSNDQRLDNTIRSASPGIRDVIHAGAILFSDLITYDARYVLSTDAQAFHEAYGDRVGGIGSYPVLGNPHYHQATDRLETINHRLVAEVSRASAAALWLMAHGPAPPTGLTVRRSSAGAEVSWDASPEFGVVGYRVRVRRPGEASWTELESRGPSVDVGQAPDGTEILVKARTGSGAAVRESWDWARFRVGAPGSVPPA